MTKLEKAEATYSLTDDGKNLVATYTRMSDKKIDRTIEKPHCAVFLDVDEEGCVVGIELVFGQNIKVKP